MINLLNCLFSGHLIQKCRINKLRFSDSLSLSFKTRLTSVTCFNINLVSGHGTKDDDVTLKTKRKGNFLVFSRLKTNFFYKIRIMSEKR